MDTIPATRTPYPRRPRGGISSPCCLDCIVAWREICQNSSRSLLSSPFCTLHITPYLTLLLRATKMSAIVMRVEGILNYSSVHHWLTASSLPLPPLATVCPSPLLFFFVSKMPKTEIDDVGPKKHRGYDSCSSPLPTLVKFFPFFSLPSKFLSCAAETGRRYLPTRSCTVIRKKTRCLLRLDTLSACGHQAPRPLNSANTCCRPTLRQSQKMPSTIAYHSRLSDRTPRRHCSTVSNTPLTRKRP
jgi:hypothetical protein